MKRKSSLLFGQLNRIYVIFVNFLILMIRGYQVFISPYLPSSCRFYPSCSQYALEAYHRFGLLEGTRLSMIRLFKCHPFHSGGCDFVPEKPTQIHD